MVLVLCGGRNSAEFVAKASAFIRYRLSLGPLGNGRSSGIAWTMSATVYVMKCWMPNLLNCTTGPVKMLYANLIDF